MSSAYSTNPMNLMNTTHNTETKRLIATLGVAATAALAPALLFGSGVAAGPPKPAPFAEPVETSARRHP